MITTLLISIAIALIAGMIIGAILHTRRVNRLYREHPERLLDRLAKSSRKHAKRERARMAPVQHVRKPVVQGWESNDSWKNNSGWDY